MRVTDRIGGSDSAVTSHAESSIGERSRTLAMFEIVKIAADRPRAPREFTLGRYENATRAAQTVERLNRDNTDPFTRYTLRARAA